MSIALLSDLSAKPIDESLSELDTRSKDISTTNEESITIGPFGVFSTNSLAIADNAATADAEDEDLPIQGDSLERTPQTVESSESLTNLHDWLDWPDLFELDFNFPDATMPEADNIFDENDPLAQPFLMGRSESSRADSTAESSMTTLQPYSFVAGVEPILITSSEQSDRLQGMKQTDIELLLNHFQENVIALIAPLPLGNKSAWEVTHVNSAILTLAKRTYLSLQHVSDAALANLQAICAIAANHYAFKNPNNHDHEADRWQDIANRTIKQAKENLQRSLRDGTQGPHAAKYKDQLMAISAVMTFAVGLLTMDIQTLEADPYPRFCMINREKLEHA